LPLAVSRYCLDLYTSGTDGNNTGGQYRYGSNSTDTTDYVQLLTPTSPSGTAQAQGITLTLFAFVAAGKTIEEYGKGGGRIVYTSGATSYTDGIMSTPGQSMRVTRACAAPDPLPGNRGRMPPRLTQ
jgi:hypothetical protein